MKDKNVQSKVNKMVEMAYENNFCQPDGHGYSVRCTTFDMLKTAATAHLTQFTVNPREALVIANAAYLHDIGKLLTPRRILNKRGALTEKQRYKIQLHTTYGAMLLYFHPQFHTRFIQHYAFEIALHHHERIDGCGYPDGRRGSDLAPWLQVVSLADSYVSLTEDRPYRPALSPHAAWDMILRGGCGTFDLDLLHCMSENQSGWMRQS